MLHQTLIVKPIKYNTMSYEFEATGTAYVAKLRKQVHLKVRANVTEGIDEHGNYEELIEVLEIWFYSETHDVFLECNRAMFYYLQDAAHQVAYEQNDHEKTSYEDERDAYQEYQEMVYPY